MIAAILRRRFIFAPPLLSTVVKPFAGYEHVSKFFELVKEYMPEEREELLKLTPTDAARRFIALFSEQYFPIDIPNYVLDNDKVLIHQLLEEIPIRNYFGMARGDYDSRWGNVSLGQLLAEIICECPFEGDDRLAVIDGFKSKFEDKTASAILKQLPSKGYTLKQVEAALEGSPYEGLLIRCRWVFGKTGNLWLDTERYSHLEWREDYVAMLTRDWPLYKDLERQMDRFDSWIGHKTNERYMEIVSYIKADRAKLLTEVLSGCKKD